MLTLKCSNEVIFSSFLGALLESIQHGRNPRLRVGILYFSSVLFSIVAASFPIHQEIEGASAGVFGLMGGHIGKKE